MADAFCTPVAVACTADRLDVGNAALVDAVAETVAATAVVTIGAIDTGSDRPT